MRPSKDSRAGLEERFATSAQAEWRTHHQHRSGRCDQGRRRNGGLRLRESRCRQARTESLAEELKDEGITVNAVLPSIIDTPANRRDMPAADFSRWVTPDAVADVIIFLASHAARGSPARYCRLWRRSNEIPGNATRCPTKTYDGQQR